VITTVYFPQISSTLTQQWLSLVTMVTFWVRLGCQERLQWASVHIIVVPSFYTRMVQTQTSTTLL